MKGRVDIKTEEVDGEYFIFGLAVIREELGSVSLRTYNKEIAYGECHDLQEQYVIFELGTMLEDYGVSREEINSMIKEALPDVY